MLLLWLIVRVHLHISYFELYYIEQVLESGSLFCTSKHDLGSLQSKVDDQSYNLTGFFSSIPTTSIPMSLQLHDLYDQFEIKLNDFEVIFPFLFLLIL